MRGLRGGAAGRRATTIRGMIRPRPRWRLSVSRPSSSRPTGINGTSPRRPRTSGHWLDDRRTTRIHATSRITCCFFDLIATQGLIEPYIIRWRFMALAHEEIDDPAPEPHETLPLVVTKSGAIDDTRHRPQPVAHSGIVIIRTIMTDAITDRSVCKRLRWLTVDDAWATLKLAVQDTKARATERSGPRRTGSGATATRWLATAGRIASHKGDSRPPFGEGGREPRYLPVACAATPSGTSPNTSNRC